MRERIYQAAVAVLLVVGAQSAAAERDELNFILGGDTAVAIFQDYERPAGVRVDDVDFSWSFYGGVRYKWLGASAGYVDFGELNANGPAFRDRVEYRGATLSGHVFMPVGDLLTVSGEVGVLFWEQSVDFQDSVGSFNANENDASLLLGLGAGYQFSPTSPFSATVRYNRFFEVGDERRTGHDNDIDRIGVGLVVDF